MVQMQGRLKKNGVTVVGVSIDVVNFIAIRDEAQKSPTLYGTRGWPETYIIDRSGIVRRKFIGPVNWNSPEITDYLTKL